MARSLSILFVLASLAIGCSCSTTPAPTDTGGRSDAPAIDAPGTTDAPATDDVPGLDATAATDAPSGTDAPLAIDAPIPTSDGPTSIVVTVHDEYVYGNCFPVPADPVIAGWSVDVSGASGTTAMLASANLTVTGAATFTQSLIVDTPTITLTGGSGSGDMRKESGNPTSVPGCGSFCGGTGATFQLDLVFVIDGVSIPKTVTGDYSCVV